jgi:hypothetical protein
MTRCIVNIDIVGIVLFQLCEYVFSTHCNVSVYRLFSVFWLIVVFKLKICSMHGILVDLPHWEILRSTVVITILLTF